MKETAIFLLIDCSTALQVLRRQILIFFVKAKFLRNLRFSKKNNLSHEQSVAKHAENKAKPQRKAIKL